MAGNIRDGTGRYYFDMFGGKKIEDGTGRDGGCKFSRRRDGTVSKNCLDGTGRQVKIVMTGMDGM